jgi:HlyD family secretion protein
MKAVRVSSRQWKIAGLVLVAIAVVLIAGLSRRDEVVGVLTAQAARADVDNRVTTNGTVIPTSEFQARAFWPGVIQKVDVELGEKVKPGQLLVSMEDPFAYSRVATADANLQAARADYEDVHKGGSQQDRITLAGDLKQAQLAVVQDTKALNALKELQHKGAASDAEINSAQQRLDSANASLKTLEEKKSDPSSPSAIRTSTTHFQ